MEYLTLGQQNEMHVAYTKPTKLNTLPQGTIWKVEGEPPEYYIQIAFISTSPEWIPFGTILEKAFTRSFITKNFIKKIIEIAE